MTTLAAGNRRRIGAGATLAVACIATGMLMLDIAVINTALPQIANDLHGGLTALAAYGVTIGASFAVGPFIGGALTSGLGWRCTLFVIVPTGLAFLIGTGRVAEPRDHRSRPVDWPGQLLLGAGLFSVILGLLRANADGWTAASCFLPLVIGAALLVAFIRVEAGSANPVLPLALFRDRVSAGIQIAAFAISASLFAVLLYATIYLQDVLGLSPIEGRPGLPARP